jgi:hypothetical protein
MYRVLLDNRIPCAYRGLQNQNADEKHRRQEKTSALIYFLFWGQHAEKRDFLRLLRVPPSFSLS